MRMCFIDYFGEEMETWNDYLKTIFDKQQRLYIKTSENGKLKSQSIHTSTRLKYIPVKEYIKQRLY